MRELAVVVDVDVVFFFFFFFVKVVAQGNVTRGRKIIRQLDSGASGTILTTISARTRYLIFSMNNVRIFHSLNYNTVINIH